MKKVLAIFSLLAFMFCSAPAQAHDVYRGNYHYSYNHHRPPMPPGHQIVVHHYNDRYHYRRPPRHHYSYRYTYRTSPAGAVLTGIAAGAIITGIFASIAD